MNRMTVLGSFLLTAAGLSFGQEMQSNPSPEDAFGTTQLVAWSRFQKPQPAPEPLPPRDTPIPQPDQQQPDRSSPPPSDQPTPAQSFVGKIMKDGDHYVLKVASNTSYQLMGEGDFGKYANENVRVVGDLDRNNNTIHVTKIELLS
jgi:Protein of unknown function (DUF5818)